jgi:hypothetical protein
MWIPNPCSELGTFRENNATAIQTQRPDSLKEYIFSLPLSLTM